MAFDALLSSGRLCPDRFLLTDAMAASDAAELVRWSVAEPSRLTVAVDHDVPVGTLAAAETQKELRDFARRHGAVFQYGEGIAYWRAMETGLGPGHILAGLGERVTTVGACGALGVRLTPDQMRAALAGEVLTVSPPRPVTVCITGAFPYGTAALDAALTLIRDHRDWSGRLILLWGGHLSLEQRAEICSLLACLKPFAAVFVPPQPHADCVLDLGTLEPLAVMPGAPGHIVPRSAADGLRVSQVLLGGCRGGGIESLRLAAQMVKGRPVDPTVRFLVSPATAQIFVQAMDEGLIGTLMQAGAVVMNQGCGACWAQGLGRVDRNEVFVTTGSINCPNWAGREHPGTWLVSPETAVRCALTGMLYER